MERASELANGREIQLEHLPTEIALPESADTSLRPLSHAAIEFEREYLLRALGTCSRAKVAEVLGLSSAKLWAKLRQHGIRIADTDTHNDSG